MIKKNQRKQRIGVISSVSRAKTITVKVASVTKHPRLGKTIRKTSGFSVHDEFEKGKIGDTVKICEVRPISKTKTWRLLSIINSKK